MKTCLHKKAGCKSCKGCIKCEPLLGCKSNKSHKPYKKKTSCTTPKRRIDFASNTLVVTPQIRELDHMELYDTPIQLIPFDTPKSKLGLSYYTDQPQDIDQDLSCVAKKLKSKISSN